MPALAKGGNHGNFRGNFKKPAVKQLTELGVYHCDNFIELESCQDFEGIGHIQTLHQIIVPSQANVGEGIEGGKSLPPLSDELLHRILM